MTMRRIRSRTSLVFFCLGVAVFAAILPSVSPIFTAVLTALWVVIPAAVVTLIRRRAVRSLEQPVSLLSLVLSRAPPSTFTLA
jgi:hypothetical protein